MTRIREYSPLDFPQVCKNLVEAGIFYAGRDSQENYDALAESEAGLILVAERDEEVVGSVTAQQYGINLAFLW